MGFRFRRSITIIPGVRLNLSNGSPSLSVGPRGASISFGSRGTYANIGLAGTGLSYRTRLDKAAASSNNAARASAETKEQLRSSLLASAEQMNTVIEQVINVHTMTPDPTLGHSMDELREHYLKAASQPYSVEAPIRPAKPEIPPPPVQPTGEEGAGFFKKLFESDADRQERQTLALANWERAVLDWEREKKLTEQRYQSQRAAWAEQYALWQSESTRHQETMSASVAQAGIRFASDTAFFEAILDEVLKQMDWPRETVISFEVIPEESLTRIDVDLPEIEDLPQATFALNRQGTQIVEKEMTQKAIREAYARHVHGILLRLIGATLYALPFENVSICGFTQRISKATGYLVDDYIIECMADRARFLNINFSALDSIDPIEAINAFSPNRKMTATFIFQSIITTR
ncbi:DUF4236 domain-containing protein [Aeromonas caviae]|uniref:DUF4236 domain-containing protein n=1 Tax=Aeromonas caviae TaxID=648 RepID=UPI00385BE0C9